MRHVAPQDSWPESWKRSYTFDLEEVFGKASNLGYAYAYACRSRLAIDLVVERIPLGARILDIGAAQGNFSLRLAELGYDVTWNDLRAELVEYVKLKYEFGKIGFVPGDIFELSFPSLFDAVLITEIIEHVAHPDKFLARVGALLRPGGVVIMTTPNGEYFRNGLPKFSNCPDPAIYESIQFKPDSDGHIFLLHQDEIFSLGSSAGLVVERIEHFTNPLTSGHLKTATVLNTLPAALVLAIEDVSKWMPPSVKRRLMLQVCAVFSKPESGR